MTEQNGVGRSSATDELRRMLDERGVEWEKATTDLSLHTSWSTKENFCVFNEWIENVDVADTLTVYHATPEQAIAATLGRTCHNVSKWVNVFECSECGFDYDFVTEPYQGPNFCPNCGKKVVDE